MTRLPRISGKEVIKALQRGGFSISHVRGSHHYLRKPGIPGIGIVIVPVHGKKDIPPGTLRSILRQAHLSIDDFIELLNK